MGACPEVPGQWPAGRKNRATLATGLTRGDAKPDEEGIYQDIMQILEWTPVPAGELEYQKMAGRALILLPLCWEYLNRTHARCDHM